MLDRNEEKAKKYIVKHNHTKRWIALALCMALITGTVTMYMLNKPATAVTEEGSADVGMVLDTSGADESDESSDDTDAAVSEVEEAATEESDTDDASEDGANDEGLAAEETVAEDASEGSAEADGEVSEEASEDANEGSSEASDEATEENSDIDNSVSEDTENSEALENSDATENSNASNLADSSNVSLTADVNLMVSYVDENGEAVAEEKAISLTDSMVFADEARKIDGYTFKSASIDGTIITALTAKQDANAFRYYVVLTEDGSELVVKEDKTVVLTYSVEVSSGIALKAIYQDKDGNEIKEATELNISEETKLTRNANIENIDNYFYMKAIYEDKQITKIAPIVLENTDRTSEEKKTLEDDTEDSEAAENSNVSGYELTTKDGEIITVSEDAEIAFIYYKNGSKEEFTFEDGQKSNVAVKATVTNPAGLPEGAELSVTEIDSDTKGYNYDAYLQAMNENAQTIADDAGLEEKVEYTENNTLLYDIAFFCDGEEVQPVDSEVTVNFEFKDNQLTKDLSVVSEEDITVVHLPIKEDVKETSEITSTEEATDITSEDIEVKTLVDATAEVEEADSESINFATGSFSIYAITKNVKRSTYSWTGDGLVDNTPKAIVTSLGKAVYFGVVADYFYSSTAHFEANVAVNKLGDIPNSTLFDYEQHYIHTDEYKSYKVSVTKKSTIPGTFNFGLYEDESATKEIKKISIEAKEFKDGWYVGTQELDGVTDSRSGVYVYELDDKGQIVKNKGGYGNYTVTYSSDLVDTNDAVEALLSSYITEWKDSDAKLQNYISSDSTVYYSDSANATSYKRLKRTGEPTTIEGTLPVKASDLLNDAENVAKTLPYAKSENGIKVINVIAQTGTFIDDLYNAAKDEDEFKWTDKNDVTNKDKGIQFSGKLLVINLDLSKYDNYEITQFFVNGVDSSADFNELDEHIIINPVRYINGEYVPYDGTFTVTNVMGTILAPCATIEEKEINGALIGKTVHHSSGEIHKTTLIKFLEVQGNVEVTNTSKYGNVEILLHKYLDNGIPNKTFNFSIKRLKDDNSGWSNGKVADGEHTIIQNTGTDIAYIINPDYWSMTPGNTYYFKVEEEKNDADEQTYEYDESTIFIKVIYKADGESEVSYYHFGPDDKTKQDWTKQDWKWWTEKIKDDLKNKDGTVIKLICEDAARQISGDEVAFYNKTKTYISVSVLKEWDELVGLPKKGDKIGVPDSIWDVRFKLFSSLDGGKTWTVVEDYTIKAPRIYQTDAGGSFAGEMNDYDEGWCNLEYGDHTSKTITFDNLSPDCMYKVAEYYGDILMGESQAVNPGDNVRTELNGDTVNGFKLEFVDTTSDKDKNLTFKLHNTPYEQVYKYWRLYGSDTNISYEETSGFSSVYVKLFRYKRSGNTSYYVPITYDELYEATPERYRQFIHRVETDESDIKDESGQSLKSYAIIELCYANEWYCEFALDRKNDNGSGQNHVYQYNYQIRECDISGNNVPESDLVLYGGSSISNVTRTTSDTHYKRGFDGDTYSDKTVWSDLKVTGNNQPVNILTVTNIRGGFVLPKTGGSGTMPFSLAGAGLIGAAFLGKGVFRRRKRT
ncbi:MAG: LPXTG cell wall anchor domain-containing protein [Butyrivibrio sp.]|nr:LPXTG cell wall anchor domain-containing protein [Butyrivibrio sp.]